MQGDSPKIFVHVNNHNPLCAITNQANTIDNILSDVVNHSTKKTLIDIPYIGLKVKGRKKCKTKIPFPCRRFLTICAINPCQHATLHGFTKMKSPFLPFDKPTYVPMAY